MGVLFGCNFDVNLNETCSGVAADTNSGLVYDASLYKFGSGSIKRAVAGARTIEWIDFPVPRSDNGMIGFWVRDGVASSYFCEITINSISGNSAITINILGSPTTHNITLTMTDSGGVGVINSVLSTGTPIDGSVWHYYELNWLWNTLVGITELSTDGVVLISSTSGNTVSRAGIAVSDVSIRIANNDHLDDFVILPTRKHVGNFTPPIASQVVCGVFRIPTIGSPFHMNPLGN